MPFRMDSNQGQRKPSRALAINGPVLEQLRRLAAGRMGGERGIGVGSHGVGNGEADEAPGHRCADRAMGPGRRRLVQLAATIASTASSASSSWSVTRSTQGA